MAKFDLKLYRGYVNEDNLVVFGHVFKSWAPDKYCIDGNSIRHATSIFHMFRIKPYSNIEVELNFKNTTVTTKTAKDGFFKFTIPFTEPLESGWHLYTITCAVAKFGIVNCGEVLKPFKSKFGIISDIDDTFLVSYSNNFLKKLFVLLLKNLKKRKIFIDVKKHYEALSTAGQTSDVASNSFFYVSSSEWNLYEFILAFTQLHNLPKAVIKLKKIKAGISDFIFTGRGDHNHKFIKIKEIISFYPKLQYVLIGDDTQQDPFIYELICKTFPENIKAVYIRRTRSNPKPLMIKTFKTIESLKVDLCYFKYSEEAIKHSKEIGVI